MKRIKKQGVWQSIGFMLSVAAYLCFSTTSQSQITASPTFSRSPAQRFPRVSGLTQKDLNDQVNALLAKKEQEDRATRKDCLQIRIPELPRPTYDETIRLTYLSSRLLSIDIRNTRIGCDAYPNIDITYSLTINLMQGKKLDWHLFFKDGFLEDLKGDSFSLLKIYLHHAHPDEECLKVVNDPNVKFDLWLDGRRAELMAKPSLPHVVQACAVLVGIPFAEIQEAIRDPLDRQELVSSKSQLVQVADKPLP
jgi:hypothetical protein